jgi:biotin carboxyl carrier protein
LKVRVSVNGESLLLDLANHLQSVEEVKPGVYSVLLNGRSYQANVAANPEGFEVWVGLKRYSISLADARDRASNSLKAGAAGPIEIRAQMPGKIIKLLVQEGAAVSAGQGIIVVEAMKMQNEVKAPKDGTLTRIHVAEGATVRAGEPLLTVE